MWDWMADFNMLFKGFLHCKDIAEQINSPDPEDDLYIKMAIVGYSFHQPTEEWGIDNLHFIERYRLDEYSDTQLSDRGDSAVSEALFACLSLGYMLGLYQAGSIDEIEFNRGEAILPGFLALRGNLLPIG